MSLVERALKKMQAARPEPAQPTGTTTPVRIPIAPKSEPAPTPAPTRILHIDRDALRAAGVLLPAEEEHLSSQEYRQIKRPLIANALGRGVPQLANGHLIMLASALPGDGKTFTSINLALSLALEKDMRTLLVDADVAKPHISRILGVRDEPGLLDVLRDERTDDESLNIPTDKPGLSVLPAGRPSDTATELLASARMEALVAQIGARDSNRIVLFDSPPLLLTTESRALAGVVGQIVLVVRAGVTPQQAVFDSLELLGDGKSIGLVLNQSDEGRRSSYYGYYGQPEGTADTAA
jgi:exopolysaccharide/PEP-CTERM locus tyrosine autokinase